MPQYKTLVLQLLRSQFPDLHRRLKRSGTLLAGLDPFSMALKSSHESWKDCLSEQSPSSHPSQIASEALEMALRELQDRLSTESRWGGDGPLSLDGAMAFLKEQDPSE